MRINNTRRCRSYIPLLKCWSKELWSQQPRIITYQPDPLKHLTQGEEQRKSRPLFSVPTNPPHLLTRCPTVRTFLLFKAKLMRRVSQTQGYTVGYLYPMNEENHRLVNFTSFIPV